MVYYDTMLIRSIMKNRQLAEGN